MSQGITLEIVLYIIVANLILFFAIYRIYTYFMKKIKGEKGYFGLIEFFSIIILMLSLISLSTSFSDKITSDINPILSFFLINGFGLKLLISNFHIVIGAFFMLIVPYIILGKLFSIFKNNITINIKK